MLFRSQTTGDRRLAALFLGHYLINHFDECQELNNKMMNIDLRTWLLNVDLCSKNEKDFSQSPWFIR